MTTEKKEEITQEKVPPLNLKEVERISLLHLNEVPREEQLAEVSPQARRTREFNKEITPSHSPAATFFTLFKGLVAIGILYLPIGFSHGGWLFSIIAFIFCGFFTMEGLDRLIKTHEVTGDSYYQLGKKTGGRCCRTLIEILILLSQVFMLWYYC